MSAANFSNIFLKKPVNQASYFSKQRANHLERVLVVSQKVKIRGSYSWV